jgi:hypothetical protein
MTSRASTQSAHWAGLDDLMTMAFSTGEENIIDVLDRCIPLRSRIQDLPIRTFTTGHKLHWRSFIGWVDQKTIDLHRKWRLVLISRGWTWTT